MNTIEEIKARLDIVDLVSETVQLRRSGKSYTGFCPFHPNSRTPAFVVFPESGTWRCFGQCNEGGDIFRFVMKKEGWDFGTALKALAERAGVQLQPPTPESQVAAEEHERLRTLLEEAATFYRHHLFHTPAGSQALDYLHRRGLQDAILETFELGYAPDAWEMALQHFTARGYSRDDLLGAGLVTERDSGGMYDRFRNRIVFPIRDAAGKAAGFGARVLDPNDVPKFINSPQTILFDKGRLLYGLDRGRKAIRSQDQVVVVEGYLDVIALHQGGFANTVSPMGTALTEDQLRMLKRFTRRIVLALDADAAGEKATLRGLQLARQAMDHQAELAFDAHGLLRQEARLQADLRVTTLPPGMDPDEVVLRNPAEWSSILEAARPVVLHVMETLAAGQDLDDPKVKSQVAAQVLPLIEDVSNPVERDAYRQRLARLLKVDERALVVAMPVPSLPRRRRSGFGRGEAAAGPGARSEAAKARAARSSLSEGAPASRLEEYVLSALVQHPELIHLLDRILQQAELGRLETADFERTEHQLVFRLVRDSVEQAEDDPAVYIQAHTALPQTGQALEDMVGSLRQKPLPDEPIQDRLVEDLARAVIRMRYQQVGQSLNQLRFLQEDQQEQGDLLTRAYTDLVLQHIQARDRLDRALQQHSAAR